MNNLCLGTVQFGLNYGVSNEFGKPEGKEVNDIIKFALNNNINFFDTAQSYGDSEVILGEAFNDLGVQNDVNVISKLSPNIKLNEICDGIDKSIKNLNVNSLWGLLLHRYDPNLLDNKFRDLIINSKKQNKILNFGVSVYCPNDAMKVLDDDLFEIIQVPFNIIDRRLIDNQFFKKAKEKNKKVFVRSVYLQGLLLMSDSDLIKKKMGWTIPFLSKLRDYTKLNKIEIKPFAFRAINNYISDCFLITGVDSLDQLKENIRILNEDNYSDKVYKNWWEDLNLYPEKLLNPSLW